MKTTKKITFLLLAFSFFTCNLQAQSKKMEKVSIIETSSRAVYLLSDFFNDGIQKELLKQINAKQLQDVMANSAESTYPDCIKSLLDGDNNEDLFNAMNLYRIATFDNIRGGENYGEQSVLLVKASENQGLLQTDCFFDNDFYIIINSTDVGVVVEE